MTPEDYNTCVDCHADALYRFLVRGTRDSERARDLVQDAFERLWVRHGEVDTTAARAWLFTTGYRAMIDALRRDRFAQGDAAPAPRHDGGQWDGLNEALHAAVALLPADQRAVILLRDYEGYTYEEIGGITGLSATQVKVYLYRARVFLRDYIGSIERVL